MRYKPKLMNSLTEELYLKASWSLGYLQSLVVHGNESSRGHVYSQTLLTNSNTNLYLGWLKYSHSVELVTWGLAPCYHTLISNWAGFSRQAVRELLLLPCQVLEGLAAQPETCPFLLHTKKSPHGPAMDPTVQSYHQGNVQMSTFWRKAQYALIHQN